MHTQYMIREKYSCKDNLTAQLDSFSEGSPENMLTKQILMILLLCKFEISVHCDMFNGGDFFCVKFVLHTGCDCIGIV